MRLDRAQVETMLGIIGDKAKNRGDLVPTYVRELLIHDAEQRQIIDVQAQRMEAGAAPKEAELAIRLQMEALICTREGMLACNAECAWNGHSQTYTEEDFDNVRKSFEALRRRRHVDEVRSGTDRSADIAKSDDCTDGVE